MLISLHVNYEIIYNLLSSDVRGSKVKEPYKNVMLKCFCTFSVLTSDFTGK